MATVTVAFAARGFGAGVPGPVLGAPPAAVEAVDPAAAVVGAADLLLLLLQPATSSVAIKATTPAERSRQLARPNLLPTR
jgi:hypothetical protein